ncbi:unnamed protein product (macronuclear) [Paramecium tetraurelia]|uniref:Kelch motif family protein n=1 Tax=Paramecium tetraurelia TaxID=5888 RepID=A0CJJ4_PARTE|nr:uncharacterized protein GSPATT00000672001 [Paramecium tetraurelia]CAK70961.1 unnamed protein product [Paramecium tetraurelia]|eukprot:XP_001438358.1 hypothetical protein (macronuclear) [Paramecium tetraurelia strain d4-2]
MYSNRSQQQKKEDTFILGSVSPTDSQTQETQYKYLPLVTKAIQGQLDPKWQECKIKGKNLTPRSNCAITIHQNHLYLYGGYQSVDGILKDFYKLNLGAEYFYWQNIKCDYEPGPRCRHTFCAFKDSLYLFGGQTGDSITTNEIFVHDVNLGLWTKLSINDSYPQPLDNYCATIYNDQLIIFGGFYTADTFKHSNDLYSFSFTLNKWVKLNKSKGKQPSPRDGSSIAIHNQILYMFGGKNGDLRYNDLWQFDFSKQEWHFIPVNNLFDIPMSRSGHSLKGYQDELILFGGIHDVTWELDDLYKFQINLLEWKMINKDTSRRKDLEVPSPTKSNRNTHNKRRSIKLPSLLRPLSLRRSPCTSPKKVRSSSQSQHSCFYNNQNGQQSCDYQNNSSSINTTINYVQERIQLQKLKKKAAMLKLFEVEMNKRAVFQDDCNVTEKLKTSIILIGNPKQDLKLTKGALTEFGQQIVSKFLLPLSNGQNTIYGKKPCARDGHAVAIIDDQMVLFGGDRHTMSFNDLYLLNLKQF